jgi:hypothetical protein
MDEKDVNKENEQENTEQGQEQEQEKSFPIEYVKALREENAKYRTKAKEVEEKLNKVLKSLGLDEGSNEQTLEEVIAQKDKLIKDLTFEKSFGRIADKLEVDPLFTKALLREQGKLENVDPSSETFEKLLLEEIKSLIEEYPQIKKSGNKPQVGIPPNQGTPQSQVDMNSIIRKLAKK